MVQLRCMKSLHRLVDWPQSSGANLYPPGFWFADVIMSPFSGVTFVLFCFVFVFMLSLKPWPFVQSLFVLRSSICMVPEGHTRFFLFLFFSFFFFRGVSFSEYFCTVTVFSVYGEYVVRFPLPDGVFLPCNHRLDFLHQVT